MAEGGKAMGKGGSGKAMANEDTGATREGTLGLIQQNGFFFFFWGGGVTFIVVLVLFSAPCQG